MRSPGDPSWSHRRSRSLFRLGGALATIGVLACGGGGATCNSVCDAAFVCHARLGGAPVDVAACRSDCEADDRCMRKGSFLECLQAAPCNDLNGFALARATCAIQYECAIPR
jgi:hypothetical protein